MRRIKTSSELALIFCRGPPRGVPSSSRFREWPDCESFGKLLKKSEKTLGEKQHPKSSLESNEKSGRASNVSKDKVNNILTPDHLITSRNWDLFSSNSGNNHHLFYGQDKLPKNLSLQIKL